MYRTKLLATKQKRVARPWTSAEVTRLRSAAGRQSADTIAKRLKRTPGAVRQKAMAAGISLRLRTR